MKKIENIIDSCRECRHCQKYVSNVNYGEAWFCGHEDLDKCDDHGHFIAIAGKSATRPTPVIPDWCPLETYKETASTSPTTPQTVILPGMPGLEWMTENLQGFGGTEIDGRTYYTWEEAMAAAEQLGDGWRLPTREEFEKLCDLGSTWDDERKGRWFGGNHDTDHKGSLFFPAAGYRYYATGALGNVGTYGEYFSSSPLSASIAQASALWFYSGNVSPLSNPFRAYGRSVRCVRNIK